MQSHWKSYIVGGAIRDQLLGLPVQEYDHVVVGARPQDLLDLGFTQVGKDFPVFLHPQTKEEYALARTERKTAVGYRGFQIHATPNITLEQDLLRRDLTLNAMAKDNQGQLIDPYGGLQDINDKLLRHVSSAFTEDPLRVLRLARFHAHLFHLGFQIAPATQSLARQIVASGELKSIAKERLWAETLKALKTPNPWVYFNAMQSFGAWQVLAPDIATLLQQKKSALSLLSNITHQIIDPIQSLALLLHPLNKPQLDRVGNDLCIPKQALQLCLQLSRYHRKILHYPNLKAQQRHTLLGLCGALKNPPAFKKLVDLVNLIHSQGQMELPMLSFGQSLWDTIQLDIDRANQVRAETFMTQGIRGEALGEAIKAGQIAAISS